MALVDEVAVVDVDATEVAVPEEVVAVEEVVVDDALELVEEAVDVDGIDTVIAPDTDEA